MHLSTCTYMYACTCTCTYMRGCTVGVKKRCPYYVHVATHSIDTLIPQHYICTYLHIITSVDAGASLGASLRELAAVVSCSVYSNAQIPQRRRW